MTADKQQKPTPTDAMNDAMSRRNAMRLLSALGGAALGSLVLPPSWSTPRLEFGLLPAHAATSDPTSGCSSVAGCGTGALAVPFDTATPAVAAFSVSPYGVSTGNLFVVQFNPATQQVTVTPANGSGVASASMGSAANGVLTYTWSAASPTNTVNVIVPGSDGCSATQQYRMTVDLQIAGQAGSYTLNVLNLSSALCSFN